MTFPTNFRVNTGLCTACRACELACHYHHTENFGMTDQSIHIYYDADTSRLNIDIDATCDQCLDEDVPFCVLFCGPGAIQSGSFTTGNDQMNDFLGIEKNG